MPEAGATVKDGTTVERQPPTGIALTQEQEIARDREIFQRLQAESAPEPKPAPEPKAGPSAKVEAPTTERTEAEPSTDDGSNRRELETIARSVLKRDGTSGAALDALLKLPDSDLTSLIEARKRAQAVQDGFGNKIKSLEEAVKKV